MTSVLSVIAFACGIGLTWLVRHYAMRANLLDVPNRRSSHVVATPRGGGLSIAAVVLGMLVWVWLDSSERSIELAALWFGSLPPGARAISFGQS